uniref:Ret finger protein like 4B n=2 Tax=Pipistrellus kuhlii TaxID=59472 RepID=A0A7J7YNX6_PIPKU|nr:ret finger protein like 4B [Pipistrellus kuhlii]
MVSLQDEVICSICLEFFSNPISLSCEHIFCSDCMRKWLLESEYLKLTCPLCRKAISEIPWMEWEVGLLTICFEQHSFLLEQSLSVRDVFRRFQKHMTLDAATANSSLVLSDDLRQVRCGKIRHNAMEDTQRFTYMACVLGTPCFSSGRHYWEVEVEEGRDWALGVCKASVDRRRKSGFSSEQGFWVMSMKAGTILFSSTPETSISASPRLRRVGVFLDVEMEEIKFFDVINDALIYKCSDFFWEPLRPLFCAELPGEEDNGGLLSICL